MFTLESKSKSSNKDLLKNQHAANNIVPFNRGKQDNLASKNNIVPFFRKSDPMTNSIVEGLSKEEGSKNSKLKSFEEFISKTLTPEEKSNGSLEINDELIVKLLASSKYSDFKRFLRRNLDLTSYFELIPADINNEKKYPQSALAANLSKSAFKLEYIRRYRVEEYTRELEVDNNIQKDRKETITALSNEDSISALANVLTGTFGINLTKDTTDYTEKGKSVLSRGLGWGQRFIADRFKLKLPGMLSGTDITETWKAIISPDSKFVELDVDGKKMTGLEAVVNSSVLEDKNELAKNALVNLCKQLSGQKNKENTALFRGLTQLASVTRMGFEKDLNSFAQGGFKDIEKYKSLAELIGIFNKAFDFIRGQYKITSFAKKAGKLDQHIETLQNTQVEGYEGIGITNTAGDARGVYNFVGKDKNGKWKFYPRALLKGMSRVVSRAMFNPYTSWIPASTGILAGTFLTQDQEMGLPNLINAAIAQGKSEAYVSQLLAAGLKEAVDAQNNKYKNYWKGITSELLGYTTMNSKVGVDAQQLYQATAIASSHFGKDFMERFNAEAQVNQPTSRTDAIRMAARLEALLEGNEEVASDAELQESINAHEKNRRFISPAGIKRLLTDGDYAKDIAAKALLNSGSIYAQGRLMNGVIGAVKFGGEFAMKTEAGKAVHEGMYSVATVAEKNLQKIEFNGKSVGADMAASLRGVFGLSSRTYNVDFTSTSGKKIEAISFAGHDVKEYGKLNTNNDVYTIGGELLVAVPKGTNLGVGDFNIIKSNLESKAIKTNLSPAKSLGQGLYVFNTSDGIKSLSGVEIHNILGKNGDLSTGRGNSGTVFTDKSGSVYSLTATGDNKIIGTKLDIASARKINGESDYRSSLNKVLNTVQGSQTTTVSTNDIVKPINPWAGQTTKIAHAEHSEAPTSVNNAQGSRNLPDTSKLTPNASFNDSNATEEKIAAISQNQSIPDIKGASDLNFLPLNNILAPTDLTKVPNINIARDTKTFSYRGIEGIKLAGNLEFTFRVSKDGNRLYLVNKNNEAFVVSDRVSKDQRFQTLPAEIRSKLVSSASALKEAQTRAAAPTPIESKPKQPTRTEVVQNAPLRPVLELESAKISRSNLISANTKITYGGEPFSIYKSKSGEAWYLIRKDGKVVVPSEESLKYFINSQGNPISEGARQKLLVAIERNNSQAVAQNVGKPKPIVTPNVEPTKPVTKPTARPVESKTQAINQNDAKPVQVPNQVQIANLNISDLAAQETRFNKSMDRWVDKSNLTPSQITYGTKIQSVTVNEESFKVGYVKGTNEKVLVRTFVVRGDSGDSKSVIYEPTKDTRVSLGWDKPTIVNQQAQANKNSKIYPNVAVNAYPDIAVDAKPEPTNQNVNNGNNPVAENNNLQIQEARFSNDLMRGLLTKTTIKASQLITGIKDETVKLNGQEFLVRYVKGNPEKLLVRPFNVGGKAEYVVYRPSESAKQELGWVKSVSVNAEKVEPKPKPQVVAQSNKTPNSPKTVWWNEDSNEQNDELQQQSTTEAKRNNIDINKVTPEFKGTLAEKRRLEAESRRLYLKNEELRKQYRANNKGSVETRRTIARRIESQLVANEKQVQRIADQLTYADTQLRTKVEAYALRTDMPVAEVYKNLGLKIPNPENAVANVTKVNVSNQSVETNENNGAGSSVINAVNGGNEVIVDKAEVISKPSANNKIVLEQNKQSASYNTKIKPLESKISDLQKKLDGTKNPKTRNELQKQLKVARADLNNVKNSASKLENSNKAINVADKENTLNKNVNARISGNNVIELVKVTFTGVDTLTRGPELSLNDVQIVSEADKNNTALGFVADRNQETKKYTFKLVYIDTVTKKAYRIGNTSQIANFYIAGEHINGEHSADIALSRENLSKMINTGLSEDEVRDRIIDVNPNDPRVRSRIEPGVNPNANGLDGLAALENMRITGEDGKEISLSKALDASRFKATVADKELRDRFIKIGVPPTDLVSVTRILAAGAEGKSDMDTRALLNALRSTYADFSNGKISYNQLTPAQSRFVKIAVGLRWLPGGDRILASNGRLNIRDINLAQAALGADGVTAFMDVTLSRMNKIVAGFGEGNFSESRGMPRRLNDLAHMAKYNKLTSEQAKEALDLANQYRYSDLYSRNRGTATDKEFNNNLSELNALLKAEGQETLSKEQFVRKASTSGIIIPTPWGIYERGSTNSEIGFSPNNPQEVARLNKIYNEISNDYKVKYGLPRAAELLHIVVPLLKYGGFVSWSGEDKGGIRVESKDDFLQTIAVYKSAETDPKLAGVIKNETANGASFITAFTKAVSDKSGKINYTINLGNGKSFTINSAEEAAQVAKAIQNTALIISTERNRGVRTGVAGSNPVIVTGASSSLEQMAGHTNDLSDEIRGHLKQAGGIVAEGRLKGLDHDKAQIQSLIKKVGHSPKAVTAAYLKSSGDFNASEIKKFANGGGKITTVSEAGLLNKVITQVVSNNSNTKLDVTATLLKNGNTRIRMFNDHSFEILWCNNLSLVNQPEFKGNISVVATAAECLTVPQYEQKTKSSGAALAVDSIKGNNTVEAGESLGKLHESAKKMFESCFPALKNNVISIYGKDITNLKPLSDAQLKQKLAGIPNRNVAPNVTMHDVIEGLNVLIANGDTKNAKMIIEGFARSDITSFNLKKGSSSSILGLFTGKLFLSIGSSRYMEVTMSTESDLQDVALCQALKAVKEVHLAEIEQRNSRISLVATPSHSQPEVKKEIKREQGNATSETTPTSQPNQGPTPEAPKNVTPNQGGSTSPTQPSSTGNGVEVPTAPAPKPSVNVNEGVSTGTTTPATTGQQGPIPTAPVKPEVNIPTSNVQSPTVPTSTPAEVVVPKPDVVPVIEQPPVTPTQPTVPVQPQVPEVVVPETPVIVKPDVGVGSGIGTPETLPGSLPGQVVTPIAPTTPPPIVQPPVTPTQPTVPVQPQVPEVVVPETPVIVKPDVGVGSGIGTPETLPGSLPGQVVTPIAPTTPPPIVQPVRPSIQFNNGVNTNPWVPQAGGGN